MCDDEEETEANILLRKVYIRATDVQLELPNGITHSDRHRTSGNKMCDLW
jgi:hypothetical protein